MKESGTSTRNTAWQPPSAAAPQVSDRALADRIVAGECDLFELVMRRFNRRLFLVARSILRSDAEAEDAVQNAYITGWRHLSEFRGPDGLGAWLSQIAKNEALMKLRKQRSRNETDLDEMPQTLADNQPGPEEQASSLEVIRLLERAIDQLPQPYRSTYVLREVEQLSVAETSASLGLNPATVKTRLHRARRLMRKHLQQRLAASVTDAFPFAGTRCDRIVERTMARIAAEVAGQRQPH